MENQILENEWLRIEIASKGAELCRIYDKENQREVLWDAKPDVWNRYAPVLFPMVGATYQQTYHLNGKAYPMTQHGFARDREFTVCEAPFFVKEQEMEKAVEGCCDMTEEGLNAKKDRQGVVSVWFKLTSDEESLSFYPFSFTLYLGFALYGRLLRVLWAVANDGEEPMLYNIGAHPAFRIPEGQKMTDASLYFGGVDELSYIHIEDPGCGCALYDQVHTMPLQEGTIAVTENFWSKGVYIFENSQVQTCELRFSDKPYVRVTSPRFPYFGIWTKDTHPFICLEPWQGRCDNIGFTGDLSEKTGIRTLPAGEEEQFFYDIYIFQ